MATLDKQKTGFLIVSLCIVCFLIIATPSSSHARVSLEDLLKRIEALEAENAALHELIDTQNAIIEELEYKLTSVTYDGETVLFEGVNVQIVSGSGSTSGTVNGLGNFIVGYNELRGANDDRTGSHNIVVGRKNNYSSYGGIVAGVTNSISGEYASVSGGMGNKASGDHSSVSGGYVNEASGDRSSVSGGYANEASGDYSSVSGGRDNEASGTGSSVSGGQSNKAIGAESSVSGGFQNEADGFSSSVSGGTGRSVDDPYNWRAGDLFEGS